MEDRAPSLILGRSMTNVLDKIRIKKKINMKINNDILNIKKLDILYQNSSKEKIEIENKILSLVDLIKNDEKNLKHLEDSINEESNKNNIQKYKLYPKLPPHVENSLQILGKLNENLDECIQNEKYYLYTSFIQYIEDTCSQLRSALLIKSYDQVLFFLKELTSVGSRLHGGQTKCRNLFDYILNVTYFWFDIYFLKLFEEYKDIASQYGWPVINSDTQNLRDFTNENNVKFADESHNRKKILTSTIKKISDLPKPLWMLDKKILERIKSLQSITDEETSKRHCDLLDIMPMNKVDLFTILLLEPFYKRFKYHFTGLRKTNQLNKPEWYYSQILEWIKLNSPFLCSLLQNSLDNLGMAATDIQIEFIKGFVYIAQNKLRRDLPSAFIDDDTFSHIIDESILFHKSLNLLGYDLNLPSCLEIFCEKYYFNKWISIEHKSATEKINEFLSSPDAWSCECDDENLLNELTNKDKIPEFVEKYVVLLEYLNDRYEYIPYPLQKIQFLSLQIELLDDFRIRLLQICRQKKLDNTSLTEIKINLKPFCYLINSFHIIIKLLEKWRDTPTFVLLAYIKRRYIKFLASSKALKCQASYPSEDSNDYTQAKHKCENPPVENNNLTPAINFDTESDTQEIESENFYKFLLAGYESDEKGASCFDSQKDILNNSDITNSNDDLSDENSTRIFSQTLELYNMAFDDALSQLVDCSLALWKSKLKFYRNQRWNVYPPKSYFINRELSVDACDTLSFMKEILFITKNGLTEDIFRKFWIRSAKNLDSYFFDEVICVNRFNEGGIAQLTHDIKNGFFVLFSAYSIIPETLFKRTCDALLILNLNRGTCLLLEENLKEIDAEYDDTLKNSKRLTEILNDICVKVLNLEEVLKILLSRNLM